jgi:hypothetical protein
LAIKVLCFRTLFPHEITLPQKMSFTDVELPFPLAPSNLANYNVRTPAVQTLFIRIWSQFLYQFMYTAGAVGQGFYTLGKIPALGSLALQGQLQALGERLIGISGPPINRDIAEHLFWNYMYQVYGSQADIDALTERAYVFVRVTTYDSATYLPDPYPS